MKNDDSCVKTYALSGGGSVTVHKPFGDSSYFAVVHQDGRYPEHGRIAENQGRAEYSSVLDGQFTYNVNGLTSILKKGDSILVPDGAEYFIEGKGSIIVFVQDSPDGQTAINNMKEPA